MDTLEKLSEISHSAKDFGNEIYEKLFESFTHFGTDVLIAKLKDTFKYAVAPEWVKDKFKEEKSYTLEVNKQGHYKKIEINACFENENNLHYYVQAVITPSYGHIRGGAPRNEMQTLVSIDDMEEFLGIKLFD